MSNSSHQTPRSSPRPDRSPSASSPVSRPHARPQTSLAFPSSPVTPPSPRVHPTSRNLTTPASAARLQSSHLRSPSTPSTLSRAINTALPETPPSIYTTPPSSFPSRLNEAVEIHPLTPRAQRSRPSQHESPFHDRHSIVVEEVPTNVDEEDPFEYASEGRQKTMSGYHFSSTSPTAKEWSQKGQNLGAAFLDVRPVSEARRSLYPGQYGIPASTFDEHPDLLPSPGLERLSAVPGLIPAPPPRVPVEPIRPTFRGLFSLSQPRDYVVYLLPAFICSAVASLVPPYMSMIIGEAFDVLAKYPLMISIATAQDEHALTSGIQQSMVKLVALGGAATVLNYTKAVLWQRHGEAVTDRLRRKVYTGVQTKGMEWFDLGMGMKEEEEEEQGESVGAGGLMAKFTRETDDVRLGMSQAMGMTLQYFLTFLFCFILALWKQPVLALVTLSTIPLVVIVQIVTQVISVPLYAAERRAFAEASTNVDRATSAIATVKVHNAQQLEEDRFDKLVGKGVASLVRQALIWATAVSMTDFLLLSTFVIGFWYGAKVVRDGKASAGTVMTVFWACLLAATYLQMVIPQLTIVTKAKNSMASLRTVVKDPPTPPLTNPFSPATSPQANTFAIPQRNSVLKGKPRPLSLQRIRPKRCRGEFNLRHISFAYPSRPENPVLRDVTLFIPPGETTFVVGGSGSGKSTIAQLLLRLYLSNGGEITMDDQSFAFLDEGFCREHIAAVQQGCILFDMSIHDNVAMGLVGAGPNLKTGEIRKPEQVSREEVVEACKMAMIHDFIAGLPLGYETLLGTGGSALSGGQRQRLAIARARIRDPTVLILDEATSALDATSRVVVFENLKAWRKNRTTIVITHDLSQIVADDFVYVMKNGVVAEQGFRSDLMRKTPLQGQNTGIFAALAAEQAIEPLPPKMEEWRDRPEDEEVLDLDDAESFFEAPPTGRFGSHRPSFGLSGPRPESVSYLDILEEYTRGTKPAQGDQRDSKRLSVAQKRLSWNPTQTERSYSRASIIHGSHLAPPSRPGSRMSRQYSFNSSPNPSIRQGSFDAASTARPVMSLEKDHQALGSLRYRERTLSENLDDDLKGDVEVVINPSPYAAELLPIRSIFSLIWHYYPTLPHKWMLFLGVVGAVAHGATTPIWSFFLARLMTIVGGGGTDPNLTKFGLIILGISAAQGLVGWVHEYLLFAVAAHWSKTIRCTAYGRVLKQDKGWFDESENAPSRLVQHLVKDADDMRNIMASVIGKIATLVAMIGLGLVWAMIIQWRLTLIGVALGPVFALLILLNDFLVGRAEVANKRTREALSRTFFESISNVRGIRAMALEGMFEKTFAQEAIAAEKTGRRAGWAIAIGVATTAGLPLFAQALMTWVGARFMMQGYIDLAQMLQVFNLVLFSLTFGTAMLDFIPGLAKAKAAARDFERIHELPTTTRETTGDLRFPITGEVSFSHIAFAYPSRLDAPILTDVSFSLTPGECVAIVGPSGSGKSTIAALLQRLYEPSSGLIQLGRHDLSRADPKWLRNHIAVVSQTANLFDASVASNIAYGSEVPHGEIVRAATSANIHDFIQSLPDGYDTNLGENASLISGGQAQRLQIARALVRRSKILILDECTSALDVDNQRAILDTIVKIKESRTTIFITHSVEAMKRCDRVICLGDGVVAEDGSFEELIARGGVFAQLMRTGEWE